MRPRDGAMRSGKSPHRRRNKFTNLCCGGYFFRARPGNEHVSRRALLQEQFGGLHHGLGMKTAAHRAIVQQVCDGNE